MGFLQGRGGVGCVGVVGVVEIARHLHTQHMLRAAMCVVPFLTGKTLSDGRDARPTGYAELPRDEVCFMQTL